MEFVTIHDLSRELNVPARVIRYRLIQLIAEGKMKENDDFHRDDYKDEQHFIWKVNPLSFMHYTGLKPVTAVNQVDSDLVTTDSKSDNRSEKNEVFPKNNSSTTVNKSDNHLSSSVNESGRTDNNSGGESLEREMIDLLKDQIKVKDGQIREQGEQLKDLNDLNVKLTGTMLQQNQKIENLLRLTGANNEETSREAGADGSVSGTDNRAQAA